MIVSVIDHASPPIWFVRGLDEPPAEGARVVCQVDPAKVYRVIDVNGEPTGLEYDNPEDAEHRADQQVGDHVSYGGWSRFQRGDRVEVLGEPGGPTLRGEYLEPTEGLTCDLHLVTLDPEFCGYMRAGGCVSYITVIAVHDDNIIHEEAD